MEVGLFHLRDRGAIDPDPQILRFERKRNGSESGFGGFGGDRTGDRLAVHRSLTQAGGTRIQDRAGRGANFFIAQPTQIADVDQRRQPGGARLELAAALDDAVHHHEDHVLIIDVGPADKVDPRVESLGKTFESVQRKAIIV